MNRSIDLHCYPYQSDPAIHVGHETFTLGTTCSTRYQQWVINLTLGGRCLWRSGGREYDLRPRHMLILRSAVAVDWRVPELTEEGAALGGTPHGEWNTTWAMFHPSPRLQQWLGAQDFEGDVAHLVLQEERLFQQMRQGLLGMHRLFTRGILHRDEWTLLALDRLVLTLHTETERRRARVDPRVRRALHCMHERYAEPLKIHDIAREAHLSVSHLSQLFAEQMGLAPVQYLERVRLDKAAGLLHFTAHSIGEIAWATGYRDADYFSRRFRRYSGQSPREFRKGRMRI